MEDAPSATTPVTVLEQKEALWDTCRVDAGKDFSGINIIFGYGSLCWKPPVASEHILRQFPAVVHKGFVRRFWQSSVGKYFPFIDLVFPRPPPLQITEAQLSSLVLSSRCFQVITQTLLMMNQSLACAMKWRCLQNY